MNAAKEEEIDFSQYGEVEEELKIKHEMEILQKNMDYYVKEEPDSKNSVIKGVLYSNYWKFIAFVAFKILLTSGDMLRPYLMSEFIKYVEEDDLPDYENMILVGFQNRNEHNVPRDCQANSLGNTCLLHDPCWSQSK